MNIVNFAVPGYQPLNRTALASHQTQMYDLRTEANVWVIKINYLPDLFDRFNRLTMDMGESSRQLRESALTLEYELVDSFRRLTKTEKELEQEADPDETKELEEYLTNVLDQARSVVTDRANRIGRCLANVNDPFDLSLTHTYIADFECEERDATLEIQLLQEKLAGVSEERQVIIEAIATLQKNGIEELGKDIELNIGKVTELGLAPPEIKLVMLAVEQLKKTLIDAGNAIHFLDLVRGSDKLRAKIEELTASINVEKSIIIASQGKVAFLNTIHAMEGERQGYADIYRIGVSAFDQFLAATAPTQFADGASRRNAFKEQTRLFISFLKPLSMPPR